MTIKMFSRYTLIFAIIILSVLACKSKKKTTKTSNSIVIPPPKPKTGTIKSFSEVITSKATKDAGLFNVYFLEDKYYYEIPDSLLGREMLAVTRYVKTPSKDGTYGGEQINEQVWQWEKKGKQILIRVPSYNNIASQDSAMSESVRNSNLAPILASFDIKARSKDSNGVVIDVTDLFAKDVPALGLPQQEKTNYKVQRLDDSRSYIDTIKSFPMNIEARTMKTYLATNAPDDASIGSVTVELNTSMILLPKIPMQARLYDERIGFFSQKQTDYGLDAQKATVTRYVRRWKLEPKDEVAYLRGELVEPKKQIVFYLDPATPKKWRPYLIEGVKDWNIAFEAAGFKNAITCLEAPTNDLDWSPEDSRYSVIRYFASNIPNAYGPHVADPRSGEIIESDIGWYHNVMNLVRNWFFVQTAAVNPDARTPKFKDEVMGQLIRFVSSHEVGHTLGLAHNFGSSYAYPVDSLRSASFTKKMGGTAPSIMDYARFNYITQPGDEGVLLYPGIGPYDKWAIKWGYTWFGNKSEEHQAAELNKWTVKKAGDPLYFYGKQTSTLIDPRSQSEDLGDDAIKASTYGITNLKRILPNIEKWTYEEGKPYSDLQELYGEVITQFTRYMGHVRANIGGIYENNKTYDQKGAVYTHVPKQKQKDALDFIMNQAFVTPTWMFNNPQLSKFDNTIVFDRISSMQASVLAGILEPGRLARITDNSAKNGSKAFGIDLLFADLQKGIFKELGSGSSIDTYRRALQRAYLERLIYLVNTTSTATSSKVNMNTSDIKPIARQQLVALKAEAKRALPRYSNVMMKAHLNDLIARIDRVLEVR